MREVGPETEKENRRGNPRQNLRIALEVGAELLSSGAEIERVEDSVERICRAFGAVEVDVFAISYVIIVTISGEGYQGLTEVRRMKGLNRNLEKLNALNELSREICSKRLEMDDVSARLEEIRTAPAYRLVQLMGIYALISAAFTLFFGGEIRDALMSGGIGVLIALADRLLMRLNMNRFVRVCLCAVWAGALAAACIRLHLGISQEMISIGNIMIFIPGVIFTCAIQEIFSDNMLTGFTRLLEAVVLSVVIATGFVLINQFI